MCASAHNTPRGLPQTQVPTCACLPAVRGDRALETRADSPRAYKADGLEMPGKSCKAEPVSPETSAYSDQTWLRVSHTDGCSTPGWFASGPSGNFPSDTYRSCPSGAYG